MQIEYEKTHYERLVDILEDAFLAGRDIKVIRLSKNEHKSISKALENRSFLSSVRRKVWIKGFVLNQLIGDELRKGYITYQVVEEQTQQSATLNMVALVVE